MQSHPPSLTNVNSGLLKALMSLLPFKWFCALSTLCCFLSLTAPGFWHKQGSMLVGSWDCQAFQFCISPCCLLITKSKIYIQVGVVQRPVVHSNQAAKVRGGNICGVWNINGDASLRRSCLNRQCGRRWIHGASALGSSAGQDPETALLFWDQGIELGQTQAPDSFKSHFRKNVDLRHVFLARSKATNPPNSFYECVLKHGWNNIATDHSSSVASSGMKCWTVL